MKMKSWLQKHRRLFWAGCAIGLLGVVCLLVWLFFGRKPAAGNGIGGMSGDNAAAGGVTDGMVTAMGVTSVGMSSDDFEVENLETNLYIEEVYVTVNSEVEEGSRVLKIADDSLAEAREELEKELLDADLKYRAGAIEYEQSKITAKYDYDTALLGGEQAEEVYNETLEKLKEQEETALKELTEAKEKIAEYEEALENGSYAEQYPYTELKALYDENLALLKQKMEEWGVTWDQITGSGSTMAGAMGGSMGNSSNGSEVTVLKGLYSVLEQNLQDYEEAQEEYDNAISDAELQLQMLQLSLSGLEAAYTQAQADAEEKSISAKLAYQTSLASAEQAERDYETALQKAQAEYEELLSDKEEAEENLALFEESVGDGYFYAASSGTVIMCNYRAGGYLQSDSVVIAYSNNEEVTVTVAVDQDDIASLAVGDNAYVQVSESGSFDGTVTAISPISDSESRTSVTYDVTVTLSGDVSDLSANLTATVIFGMTVSEGMEMQEGMEAPEGMEMPEGMEAPEGMEMPEGGAARD